MLVLFFAIQRLPVFRRSLCGCEYSGAFKARAAFLAKSERENSSTTRLSAREKRGGWFRHEYARGDVDPHRRHLRHSASIELFLSAPVSKACSVSLPGETVCQSVKRPYSAS